MPPRKRLGQLLTELKVIDEHQLQSALGHQKQWGGKLGVILVQKGFCREDQMVSALSQHLGMPAVRLADVKIDPRAVKTVSKSVAERLHVFAYEVTGSGRSEVITIAMSDPTDLSAVDQLAFHTGKRIKPMLAGDSEVIGAIQQHYGGEKPADEGQLPAGSRPFMEGARQGPGASGRLTPVAPLAPVPATGMPTPTFSRRVEPPRPPPVMAVAPHADDAPEPEATSGNGAIGGVEEVGLVGEDLPADAPVEGLEPIAAHTQGAESVEGAEDVAGQGEPADAVADLEAANPHEMVGAVDVQGLEGLERGVAPQEAEGAAPDAAAAEAPPLEDPAALQGWGEGQSEGIALETEDPAPAHAPAEGGWSETTGELPVDAIMGTAEALETAPEDAAPGSDAPDAWNDIADPLAAPSEEAPEAAWAAAAADVAAAAEEFAPEGEGESLLDPPGDPAAPSEELAIEAEGWSEDPAADGDDAQAEAAPEEEAAFVMEQDAAAEAERPITEPQGWVSPVETAEEQATAEGGYGEDAPAEQGYEQEAPGTAEEGDAEAGYVGPQAQDDYGQQELAQGEQPAEEGWVATPDEQQPQPGGLSAADLGTLAALGLDPSDSAGAQRMLACLVRVLDRRQAIDLDELAMEIRESRLAGEAAAQAPADDQAGIDPGPGYAGEPEEDAQASGTRQDPLAGSHDS